MRKLAVVLAAAVACSSAPTRPPSTAGEPALTVRGRIDPGPLGYGAAELAKLPRRTFRAVDPRTGTETAFEGVALAKLLSDRTEVSRSADILVVTGGDGSTVAIPLAAVRSARPVLADRAGGAPLEGLRLAWPNLDAPGLDSDPRSRWWWVDGVKVVEVAEWERSYARALRLPAGANDEARLGADAFTSQCIHCHKVRGAGGARGRELTQALRGTTSDAFAAGLRKHHVPGPATTSPVSSLPDAALRQIAAFLRAVDSTTQPAQDEIVEPELPPAPADPLNPPPAGVYPPPPR